MLARRQVLVGLGGFAAAGTALALAPRQAFDLMGGAKLKDIVPSRFGGWSLRPYQELVQPRTEGTLSATLYSDVLPRTYGHASEDAEVMLLMAYGSTQSDLLQLHRPESCYPAFGYAIEKSGVGVLRHRRGEVPVRQLVAAGPSRTETILYWTRIGAALPLSGAAQRTSRLRMAIAGYVPDGLLARFSVTGAGSRQINLLHSFASALLDAVSKAGLEALLGSNDADGIG